MTQRQAAETGATAMADRGNPGDYSDLLHWQGCEDRMDALQALLETKIESERKLVEERFAQASRALDIQAREYERRLGDLNKAHARADAERARVVSRELFDLHCKDFESFKTDTIRQLTAIQTRSLTWGAALALALTILSIGMHFLR